MTDKQTSAKRRAPKWWRWLRSFFGGYFWLPCPRCGEMFSGHEEGGGSVSISRGRGMSTCPNCPDHDLRADPDFAYLYESSDAQSAPSEEKP